MNVKLKVLTAGVLFFTGQALVAQEVKKDTTSTKEKTIDEVVVVAYGRQKKEAVTGSVAQIKATAIRDVSSPNVVQGAIGKVAGVQISSDNGLPGTAPVVRFRGIGSINGSSAPLYVVDGVPFNGDIAAINSADIESMSFLKDASAAALYGSRGANGVVIITTKKGRKGKTRYNLDIKAGIAQRGIPEYDIITSPQEYYEAYHRMLRSGYYDGQTTKNTSSAHTDASNELTSARGNGLSYNITNVAGNQIIGSDGKFNPDAQILYQDNWAKKLFRNGFFQNTYFSGSGGNESTSHFFSLGYESNETYMVNSKFERMTSRLKIDSKAGNRLKFGGNLAYTYMVQNAPDGYDGSSSIANPFSWTRSIAPIYPVYAYKQDGTPSYLSNGDRAYDDGNGTYNGGVTRPYGAIQNPYATALLDVKKNTTNQIYGSAYATFNILKGLDFTYTLTGEFRNYRRGSLDTSLYGDAYGVKGRLTSVSANTFSITNQQVLTYDRRFLENSLGLQAMAGHETMKYDYDYLSVSAQNGLLTSSPYINHYGILNDASGYGVPYSVEGYFGRLNLDYKNKYFVNANIRRDGSSRFHPNNRWGTFFGIGGAWVVSREPFFSKVSWLNNLRLKVSYGEQGNDNLNSGDYASYFATPYVNLFEITKTFDSNNTIISLNQVFKGNPNITWEKNANFNVGFDLDLFNNRWSIEAEYFNRKSYDMLFMKPLPLSEGFKSMPENVGDMVNRGVEVSTKVDVLRSDNFSLSITGNTTYLKNKILRLSQEEVIDSNYLLKAGNTRYTWRLREFVGVNPTTGAALFTYVDPTTGVVSTTEDYSKATLIDTGKSAVPKFYGGFGANIAYKNFDFAVNFSYQFGGWGYDSVWMTSMQGTTGQNFHKDYASTWSYDNTGAQLPVILPGDAKKYYNPSTMGLIKSDYISLQNISMGYTINKDMVNIAGIDNIRVYATADNIYVWSKRRGYDPRQSVSGRSSNNYSPIRTIALGVNVSF